MYITLYYIVTRLPDSLRLVRDHVLSVCPTTLTVVLLEERLLAAQKSIVAVGASRGDPRTPVFEGCFPSPLLPSVASSSAAADLVGFESVGSASAPSGRCRTGKGKGGKGAGGAGGGGGGGGGGSGGGGGGGGIGGGGGGVGGSSEAEEAAAVAEGAEAAVVAEAAEVAEAAAAAVELVVALRRGVVPVVVRASSSSAVVRLRPPSSFVSGTLGVSEAWPPVSLSLVSPGPSLPSLRGLPLPAFPASRGGSVPPLTVLRVSSDRGSAAHSSHGRVGPRPQSVARVTSVTFLLVVDDYSRFTTYSPCAVRVTSLGVLIDWIRAARLQLRESFGSDFLFYVCNSDRGGEFSSTRLGAFCRAQGIR
ncbi:unnamed protein product [Closterium sp. NIES-64]|nr:unnamed protein product [Closterium sp. NIES-64]